jgi:hypothetical protein
LEDNIMNEKEAAKKRARTGATPRKTKKAPTAVPVKETSSGHAEAPVKAAPRVGAEAPAKAARHGLVEAPAERCFWVNHGPILRNLRELSDALTAGISDEQFAHHVTEERNDFAAWVEVVLEHPECAQALRRARTRVGAARAVKKYVEAS